MAEQVPELERVKRLVNKLLDRTVDRGFTEHEAMQASEQVGNLLKQFDLQLSDVIIREETCVQREVFADDDTATSILSGICRLCSLKHYKVGGSTPPTFVLFGFQRDMELALFLYETLMEALATEWAEFTRINGFARKKRDNFRMGFGQRVWERLVSLRRQRDAEAAARATASSSRDLVLVRDALVEEEFQKTGVRLVRGRGRSVSDSRSFNSGVAAGNRASISTPINGDVRSMLS